MVRQPPERGEAYPSLWRGAYAVGILMLASILAYMDRGIISLLVGQLHRDLGLSDSRIGALQGAAFALFFITFSLPIGWMADRMHRPAIIAGGILVWSVMTTLTGFAHSFGQLLLARIGVGAGEACLMPAALSLLADYFPARQRGRAVGTFMAASAAGVGIALTLGGALLHALGGRPVVTLPIVGRVADWQAAFILLGCPGVAFALLLLLTLREVPRRELRPLETANAGRESGSPSLVRYIKANPSLFAHVFGLYCLTTFVTYAMAPWAATIFIRRFGATPAEAALWIGPPSAICGVLGCLVSGALGDHWTSANRRGGRLRAAAIWSVAIVPVLLLLLVGRSPFAFAAAYAAFGFFGFLVYGTGPAIVGEMVPGQLRGRTMALWYVSGGLSGIALAPVVVPLVEEHLLGSTAGLMPAIAAVTLPVVPVVLILALRGFDLLDAARRHLLGMGPDPSASPRVGGNGSAIAPSGRDAGVETFP